MADDFHKSIENIILFPGSLEELNMTYNAGRSGTLYSIIPMTGSKRYVEGVIIPTEEEAMKVMKLMGSASLTTILDAKAQLGEFSEEDKRQAVSGIMDMAYATLLEVYKLMPKNFSELDIRKQAKDMGADGLIRVTYQSESRQKVDGGPITEMNLTFYMGIPVKAHLRE